MDPLLTVREIRESDIELIADYWSKAAPEYLLKMGVDLKKMPARSDFLAMLSNQIKLDYEQKKSFALIWEVDGKPVGHSNVNPIEFGKHAFMHLHIWHPEFRGKGLGVHFVKLSVPLFFEKLKLHRLYSEPYALNPSPNKTLPKAGFKFVKSYITIPGSINFEQEVNRWVFEPHSD